MMGAIRQTATAVKKTARVTQRATRGTTDWPFALLVGPLMDLRLRRSASETGLNPTHASIRRRLEGATWARWISAVIYICVIALAIWHSAWLLAPLIPAAWAILARRRAWWRGQPTLRKMLSPGGWVVVGLSLAPPTAFLFELLFEPLPEDVRGWVLNGSGWAAAVVAFLSALAVSERLNNPPTGKLDPKDAEFMASLVGMNRTALDAAIEKKTFDAGRSGENLYAVYPLGVEAKFNRVAIEAVLAERGAQWEIAALDYEERRLTLERPSDATKRKREALALSGGLVDDLLDEDDGQSSVGLDWGRFN